MLDQDDAHLRHDIKEAILFSWHEIKKLVRAAGRIDEAAETDMVQLVTRLAEWWIRDHLPATNAATTLSMQILGGNGMASFNIVTTDTGAQVELQFDDPSGAPIDGPLDPVTGNQVTPVVTSDNSAVATVGAASAGATPSPGLIVYPLTPVAAGTANISVSPLANSDGSPVLETVGPNVGQPFEVPAPIAINVQGNAASGLTITEVG